MSQLDLRQSLSIGAAPERVWRTLIDPERVVQCLLGASLDGADDERTYRGSLRVSVGPVTVRYKGTIVFVEIDHETRRVKVQGKGREATGSGSASLVMESQVTAAGGGGSLVTVHSEVQVTGKMVTFGRGMIERVSQELFEDFARRLDELLVEPDAPQEAKAVQETASSARPQPSEPANLSGLRLLWRVFVRFLKELFGRRRS